MKIIVCAGYLDLTYESREDDRYRLSRNGLHGRIGFPAELLQVSERKKSCCLSHLFKGKALSCEDKINSKDKKVINF